jgi:prevent-host-death family protein
LSLPFHILILLDDLGQEFTMTTIGDLDAQTAFPDLINRVVHGEQITITQQGVPVAMLVPVPEHEQKSIDHAIEELLKFRQGKTLGGLSHREMIEEGRA